MTWKLVYVVEMPLELSLFRMCMQFACFSFVRLPFTIIDSYVTGWHYFYLCLYIFFCFVKTRYPSLNQCNGISWFYIIINWLLACFFYTLSRFLSLSVPPLFLGLIWHWWCLHGNIDSCMRERHRIHLLYMVEQCSLYNNWQWDGYNTIDTRKLASICSKSIQFIHTIIYVLCAVCNLSLNQLMAITIIDNDK